MSLRISDIVANTFTKIGGTSSQYLMADGSVSTLTNLVTGSASSGQIAYWNGNNTITGSSQFTFGPQSVFLINNSISAGGIAVNLVSTVNAAANNDIIYGLRISPTFSNGSFTGVTQRALGVFGDVYINGSITSGSWQGSTITVAKGGTGLTALGTANQLIRVNSGATALEYFTPTYISSYTETDTLSSVTGRGATTSNQITLSGKLRMSSDLGVDAGSTIFFGREENFGGTDTGGTDYGYITFDNNNTTYGGTGGTERSVLRIGTQNDAPGTTEDNIALEPAADLYLNPGGGIYRGNKTTRYTIWDSGNLTNLNQLTNGPGYITSSGSISGNAATADRLNSVGITNLNTDRAAGKLEYYDKSGGTGAPSDNWHSYISTRHGNSGNQYGFQLANQFGTESLFFRGWDGTNPLSWRVVLHSGNYNSYSPTLTGGGASGFWGISIDGTVSRTVAAGSDHNFLYGAIADNDFFRVRAGGASNAGYLEIATADDGTEPIYVRQYTGVFATVARTLTLLDGSGNTSIPGSLTIGGNTAIHSGNIGSQSVNYANYSGYSRRIISEYQEWDFGTGSHSTNPMSISIYDNYTQAGAPSSYGTLVDIYGLSGHQHDQLYFAQGSLKHRYGWYGNNNWSGWNEIITASNISSYAIPTGGGWYGANLPGSRWYGYSVNGGEFVLGNGLPNAGQVGVLIDGCYVAGENNGFWSLPGSNDWNARRGMYWDGSYLNFTTNTPTARFQYIRADDAVQANYFYQKDNIDLYLAPGADLSLRVYGEIANSNYQQGAMQPGALNIGRIDTNYRWDGGTWSSDIRLGILANCSEYWEIGIHDSGDSVMSALYFDGGSTITIGRSLGWGTCSLTVGGDITAFSDARVKENIKPIENALEKTLSLQGVSYNRTDGQDKRTKIGLIAQEVKEVVPEIVTEGDGGLYGVSYGNAVGLLIEAIKEQQKQIEELKSQIKNQ